MIHLLREGLTKAALRDVRLLGVRGVLRVLRVLGVLGLRRVLKVLAVLWLRRMLWVLRRLLMLVLIRHGANVVVPVSRGNAVAAVHGVGKT